MSLGSAAQAPWALPRHSIDTATAGPFPPQEGWGDSQAWGTQYKVLYIPIRVPARVTVKEMGYYPNTTATGNIDVGLYDSAGTKLTSTGSTAKSATGAVIALDVTDYTFGPGTFYLALCNDTTTDTFYGSFQAAPLLGANGVLTETLAAVTLPDNATWTVNQTGTWIPWITALLVTEVS